MKTNSIESRIRERATTKLSGHLNLVQCKQQKIVEAQHKLVCENLVNYVEAHPNVPMYIALSVGVGSGAFKSSAFEKKYKQFDEERVNTVAEMARAYNTHMFIKGKPSDVVWRLVNRYYTKKSHSVSDFKKDLAKSKVMDGNRGHYKELCKNLGI